MPTHPSATVPSGSSQTFFVCLCLGIVLVGYGCTKAIQGALFARDATETVARIVGADTVTRYSICGNYSSSRSCDFEFVVGGKTFKGDIADCNLDQGTSVTLYYRKSDPSDNQLDPPGVGYVPGIIVLVGIISLGVSAKEFFNNDDLLDD